MFNQWLASRKNKTLTKEFLTKFDEIVRSDGCLGLSLAIVEELSIPNSADQLATRHVFKSCMGHFIDEGVHSEADIESMKAIAKDLVVDYHLGLSMSGAVPEDIAKLMGTTACEAKVMFAKHHPEVTHIIRSLLPKFK